MLTFAHAACLQDGGKAKPLKKASGPKKELDDDDKAFLVRAARLNIRLALLPLTVKAGCLIVQ